jgi:hypothetical protein
MNTENLKTREIGIYALRSPLTEIVTNLFASVGQTPADEDFKFLRDELCKVIPKRYGNLTLPEVEAAFSAGLLGDYGDYYGINLVSIDKWLKGYLKSDEYKNANREEPAAESPEHSAKKTTLAPEERGKMQAEAYERALNMAKAGKYVEDWGNFAYNYLCEWGEINLSQEEWNDLMAQATRELEARVKGIKLERIFSGRLDSTDIAEMTKEEIVVMRAKRIALNVYLKKIVESES